jgi:hypothetical protein
MGRDLLDRIGKSVESFVALVAKDLILDRNDRFQKHIVQCFCFDANIELLHAKRKAADLLLARAEGYVEPWLQSKRIKVRCIVVLHGHPPRLVCARAQGRSHVVFFVPAPTGETFPIVRSAPLPPWTL